MIVEVDHPEFGRLREVRSPIRTEGEIRAPGAGAEARRAHGGDPLRRSSSTVASTIARLRASGSHRVRPSGPHRESAWRGRPPVEEIERTDVAVAPPWMTVLHNCDCHTFDEVVKQLMKAIGC